jgi:cysteine synthase A
VARRDGLLIGLSSGAVVRAYEKISRELGEGTYVLIFPDDGFKYVEIFESYLGMI